MRAAPQVTRPSRSVRSSHALRVLASSGHATVLLHVGRLLVIQTAIGPIKAEQLRTQRQLLTSQTMGLAANPSHLKPLGCSP